jgi:cytochrome b6-f complex iron-sulfur subunit
MAEENTPTQPPEGGSEQAPQQAQAPETPPAASGGTPAPRPPRREMSPEERAAAIKAAQERALRIKAEREAAARAAAGETAVATAEQPAAAPAGPVWRIPAATAQGVTIARPEARTVVETERAEREVRVSVGSFLNYFNPRHLTGFGGVIKVPASQVPQPGAEPVKIFAGKFWLVNLKPGEGGFGAVPGSQKGGLLALYQKCPHLGCTVPWNPSWEYGGQKGWFKCPCHGSTYSEGGLKVFGPAPRSMDTMALTRNPDGSVTVNTGKITLGASPSDPNNDPQRAVPA